MMFKSRTMKLLSRLIASIEVLMFFLGAPADARMALYQVRKHDTAGHVQDQFGNCPLWGRGRGVEALAALNPAIRERPNYRLNEGEVIKVDLRSEVIAQWGSEFKVDDSGRVVLTGEALTSKCSMDPRDEPARIEARLKAAEPAAPPEPAGKSAKAAAPRVASPPEVAKTAHAPRDEEFPRSFAPVRSDSDDLPTEVIPWIIYEPGYLTTSQTLGSTEEVFQLSGYSPLNARTGVRIEVGRYWSVSGSVGLTRFSSALQDSGTYKVLSRSETALNPTFKLESCLNEVSGICLDAGVGVASLFALTFVDNTSLQLTRLEALMFGAGVSYRGRIGHIRPPFASGLDDRWVRVRLGLDSGSRRGQNIEITWSSNLRAVLEGTLDFGSQKYGGVPFVGGGVEYQRAGFRLNNRDDWSWSSLGFRVGLGIHF